MQSLDYILQYLYTYFFHPLPHNIDSLSMLLVNFLLLDLEYFHLNSFHDFLALWFGTNPGVF